MEIRGKGDAGELPLEVGGVFLSILRMVEESVDVVEDIPLGDTFILIMGLELLNGLVSDVFLAVGAVFVIGVEGKALSFFKDIETGNHIGY
jgi:hypothetical protein